MGCTCLPPGVKEPDAYVGFYQPNERPAIARMLDRALAALSRLPELRGEVQVWGMEVPEGMMHPLKRTSSAPSDPAHDHGRGSL